jgi:8-oxo-dGTP pyrophosphatase MutT (NUDIX family)
MVYVTRAILEEAEGRLGVPRELAMSYEITADELAMIRASQKHDRAHDVTTLIWAEGQVAAIAKHNYPPGIYRVPGGGVAPGEPFLAGAIREALEETGLPYTPERYLLRVAARFTCGPQHVDWTTHIVSGSAPYQPPVPLDVREIREARWLPPADLLGPIAERMLATGRPLFAYRVALHRAALAALDPPSVVP